MQALIDHSDKKGVLDSILKVDNERLKSDNSRLNKEVNNLKRELKQKEAMYESAVSSTGQYNSTFNF